MTKTKKTRGRKRSEASLRNQTAIVVRCTREQKARWMSASEITGKPVITAARDLLDEHADECGV